MSISRFSLIPPLWVLSDAQAANLTAEVRLDTALRYGITHLLISDDPADALQVVQQVTSQRMRSIYTRMVVDSMLVDDMGQKALSLVKRIEDAEVRDGSYEDCVENFLADGNLNTAIDCALKITDLSRREFALLFCRSGCYALGDAIRGADIWNRYFRSYGDMEIPPYLCDYQLQSVIGTSIQPEDFVFIRSRDPQLFFESLKEFHQNVESRPEKDRFLSYCALELVACSPEKGVLVASMIEDLVERDRTYLRMASLLSSLDSKNPKAKAFALLVPEIASRMITPILKSEALAHSVRKLIFLNLIPQAVAVAMEIPDLAMRYSMAAECKEKRISLARSSTHFFKRSIPLLTILALDDQACTPLLPQDKQYLPLATCMRLLGNDNQTVSVRKMAFSINHVAHETLLLDYIDMQQKAKKRSLEEALRTDDDRAALLLFQEGVRGRVPYTKLARLFSLSIELDLKKAALMLVGIGAAIPPNMKNELLRWAKDLNMLTPLLLLIEDGAEIEMSQEDIVELINSSIESRRNKAAAILLSKINNIHAPDEVSNTFLHNACKECLYETVELLIRLGASPNFPNERGRTPMHIAQKYQNVMLLQLLQGNALEAIYAALEKPLL